MRSYVRFNDALTHKQQFYDVSAQGGANFNQLIYNWIVSFAV